MVVFAFGCKARNEIDGMRRRKQIGNDPLVETTVYPDGLKSLIDTDGFMRSSRISTYKPVPRPPVCAGTVLKMSHLAVSRVLSHFTKPPIACIAKLSIDD